MHSPDDSHQLCSLPAQIEQRVSGQVSRQESAHTVPSGPGLDSGLLSAASVGAPLPQTARPRENQPVQQQPGTVPPEVFAPEHAMPSRDSPELSATGVHRFPPPPSWQPRQPAKQAVDTRSEPSEPARHLPGQERLQLQAGADLGGQQPSSTQQPQLQARGIGTRPELGSGFGPLRQAAPRLGPEPAVNAGPQHQPQFTHSSPAADSGPTSALQAMLGSSAPDTAEETAGSDVSAQDRMKFMQSLQSPDRGGRGKTFAKGFGRMKARAKDMLQSGVQSVNTPAGQPSASQGVGAGDQPDPSAGLGRGSKMARDMTMMFAGLKRPANQ